MQPDSYLPGYLRDQWHKQSNRVSGRKTLGLLLDYDGTLTPIVNNPAQAIVSPAREALLVTLAKHPQIKMAVVSGRSINQLRGFLPQLARQSVVFCGLHGGHITVPAEPAGERKTALRVDSNPDAIPVFKARLLENLTELDLLDGHLIEDKTLSVAFHYKNMPQHQKQKAITLFMQLYQAEKPGLLQNFRVQDGKDVLELLPTTCDKGSATRWVLDYWQKQGITDPWLCYTGDDLTDEMAFAVVNQLNGLSVAIGKTLDQTLAIWCLADVNRFYEELALLLD